MLRRFDEHRQRADAPERVRSEAGHLDIRLPVSSGTWIPIARSEGRRSPGVHVCPATMRRRSPEARRSYTSEDFTNDGRGYDIVFDAVGKSSFRRCRRLLERHGVFLFTDLGFLWHVPILALLTRFIGRRRVILPIPKPDQRDIRFLKDLIEAGAFTAVIDRRYPLEAIVEAYRYVDTGLKAGNVVITVA